jgi:hypothetical protein
MHARKAIIQIILAISNRGLVGSGVTVWLVYGFGIP